MLQLIILGITLIADEIIGDPRSKFHPVVLIGNLISTLETILFNAKDNLNLKILKGGLLVSIVTLTTLSVGSIIEILTDMISNDIFKIFIQAMTLSFMISPHSLREAGKEIYFLLEENQITSAREKVGWIVGRDTKNLNESEIVRATVETIAENTVDGIISPLFYFVIGGLPFAIAYRAINTMDSMLGYKNEKYFYFGWAAARLDDIANYIPARICAMLFLVSAVILKLNYKNAFKILKRDASKHPSPNCGWVEATMAGALNIRLGGTNYYFGEAHFRAYMGDSNEPMRKSHILISIKIMHLASILFLFGVYAISIPFLNF